MTLANSNGLPMESLIVPLTLMLWAEREKESINKRKVKVLFMFECLTADDSNFNNSESIISLNFHAETAVFFVEYTEKFLSLCVLCAYSAPSRETNSIFLESTAPTSA